MPLRGESLESPRSELGHDLALTVPVGCFRFTPHSRP
jgi:hypothetical protein